MKQFRTLVENVMTSWSLAVVRYRWLVLCLVLLVTGSILPQLQNITVDVSGDSFLPKENSVVAEFHAFRDEYGSNSVGLISIQTKDSLFTLDNLKRLKALHEELENNVPHLEKITSLVNVRYSHATEDFLNVDELIEFWPEDETQLPAFRKMVLENPAYLGSIVAKSGHFTNIILKPLTFGKNGADTKKAKSQDDYEQEYFLDIDEEIVFVEGVLAIIEKHQAPGFKLYGGGIPLLNYYISKEMGDSMTQDMIACLLVITGLLFLLFRRFSGVCLPILCVILSIAMTFALTAVAGIPLYSTSQVMPTFLLAVGIADAVHIQSVFYKLYDKGMEKHEAIVQAMRRTAVAVLMTSLTTAASMFSFVASDVIPNRMLGLFGAIGILLALYYSIALIPALLAILPVRRRSKTIGGELKEAKFLQLLDKCIFSLGNFGVNHARSVVIASIILSAIAAAGLGNLHIGHDPLRWHPIDHPTRVTAELIDKEMSGTISLEILFDTGKENGVHEPAVLNVLEKVEQRLENLTVSTTTSKQVVSILSVIKETHKSLNANNPAFYVIPEQRNLIAQELLLFETSGIDDTKDFVDSQFQTTRLTAIAPWTDSAGYKPYLKKINSDISEIIRRSGVQGLDFKATGIMMVLSETISAMLEGILKSYSIAFSLVGLLMLALMGSVKRGILAFTPTAIPILFTIGLMGWLHIPMNLMTSMVGCIIIGIAVDNTIHFMHHYRRAAKQHTQANLIVRNTLEDVGRAIVFTSLVLVAGFLVHLQDQFSATRHYGLLLGFSIIVALFANLLVAPALMTLFWNNKQTTPA